MNVKFTAEQWTISVPWPIVENTGRREVNLSTGEPYAGNPPVRFGGRGAAETRHPYPYQKNPLTSLDNLFWRAGGPDRRAGVVRKTYSRKAPTSLNEDLGTGTCFDNKPDNLEPFSWLPQERSGRSPTLQKTEKRPVSNIWNWSLELEFCKRASGMLICP